MSALLTFAQSRYYSYVVVIYDLCCNNLVVNIITLGVYAYGVPDCD